ncbi:hypothetical protein D6D24_03723 [Aureobasidium pullulans]|uniref:Uncharacterized protein n=1 Tax=Aureobasidium pullulans TaxID=5580 RepID=A0A4S9JJH4_AURPU|nr:hypothetical protein D6D24_03723 [Aureobasidium pullulans]THY02484.1 hypothetical protein D6D03_05086 [Aureobasidium pullulans]
MHQLATGTYKLVWADEEEMEMNAGVPLLERAVALGRICEELWSAIMTVWNSGQNVPDPGGSLFDLEGGESI